MRRPTKARPLSLAEMVAEAQQLLLSGQPQEAERAIRRVLAIAPANPEALNLHAVIAHNAGRYEQALALADRAVALRPNAANVHANRGRTLTELGRLDDAIAAYHQALHHDPRLDGAYTGLAFALRCASRLQEAETYAREAIRRAPRDDSLHSNLGCLLVDMARPADAVDCFQQALRLRPHDPEARYNLGMALLLQGSLNEGWRHYESRFSARRPPRPFTQPQWTGQPLNGRTLLVHHEQGFGDTLQFCRFIPQAAQSGRVIVEIPKELARLVATLAGVSEIVIKGDPLPPFDLHCPMLSLPLALDTGLQDIPNTVPYLRAQPSDIAAWQQRLQPYSGPRIGLVWAGNGEIPSVDRKRSLPLDRLTPLAAIPGLTFVSLQKGATPGPAAHAFPLRDWTSDLRDFADTAALVETLDLVIGVDTSTIHLAGALGKPVWVLNRYETCWRWLLDRDTSPWYPTLKLFRQTQPGDWDPVIARVTRELARFAQAPALA